ncbi:MAG: hypothetical protein MUE84_17130 [Hyphomonas sp.]|nr:hypothetical protein [Hyphomonas sp.]
MSKAEKADTLNYEGIGNASRSDQDLRGKVAVPDPALCKDKNKRDAFLSEAEHNPPDRSLAANYNAKREEQLNARMKEIGMTARERGQLAINALRHPEFEAAMAGNLEAVRAMIAAAQAAGETRDPQVQCEAIIAMRAHLAATITGANRQWDLMDRMVEAEAARRGKAMPAAN